MSSHWRLPHWWLRHLLILSLLWPCCFGQLFSFWVVSLLFDVHQRAMMAAAIVGTPAFWVILSFHIIEFPELSTEYTCLAFWTLLSNFSPFLGVILPFSIVGLTHQLSLAAGRWNHPRHLLLIWPLLILKTLHFVLFSVCYFSVIGAVPFSPCFFYTSLLLAVMSLLLKLAFSPTVFGVQLNKSTKSHHTEQVSHLCLA